MRIKYLISMVHKNCNIFVNIMFRHCEVHNYFNRQNFKTISISAIINNNKKIINEDDDNLNELNYNELDIKRHYKKISSYTDSKDYLLNNINNCLSIEALLNLFENNINKFKSDHLIQTLFVLNELKEIYQEIIISRGGNIHTASKNFIEFLNNNKTYQKFINLCEEKLNLFDTDRLSYLLLYLNKFGRLTNDPLIGNIINKLENDLKKKFSIFPATRFLETIFKDFNLKSYYLAKNIVPMVFDEIDSCDNPETLEYLTISLNKIHSLVPIQVLNQFKNKVNKLIDSRIITSDNYKLLLEIILFLNYPQWRNENTLMINECILLLKKRIHLFTINELINLYDVFFKIQEPACILIDLQRCSAKYLQKLETITSEKIKLLSSITYFSSPMHRNNFQNMLEKYVIECDNLNDLLLLRKILSYIKVSDLSLCRLYWNKIYDKLKYENDINLMKLIQNYMNFTLDINNFRHEAIENKINNLIRNNLNKLCIYPSQLSQILSYTLVYNNNKNTTILDYLTNKFEENWTQIDYNDCLKFSISVKIMNEINREKYFNYKYLERITKVLNKIIDKEYNSDYNLRKNITLLKACIFKGSTKLPITNRLLMRIQDNPHINSKLIEDITFCFISTSTLIPQVIENLINYVCTERNLLAFNIEKVLYLCFWLGYTPTKCPNEFFNICIDIIIRDQERLSGLSLIHCGMALCYFNKLPNSMIKSIFNVEFLDRLELECANCYSKDIYPQRVRKNLMYLNRAVCLDYPESNVPWFHQKYVQELCRTTIINNTNNVKVFSKRIKEYLKQIFKNHNIIENVFTPYGYFIDFVVNISSEKASDVNSKLAILLIHQYAHTNYHVQLKGLHQMKKRHLEILGYKVVMVNFSDWIVLFYADERIDFLKKLIWPDQT